jgi:hypothetical protein
MILRTSAAVAISLVCLLGSGRASAEAERVIDSPRIRLADLVAMLPEGAAEIDLGPAPPPGGSRLLSREEILRHVREAGQSTERLAVPAAIRVTSAVRHLSARELQALVTPAIERQLPRGATLQAVIVQRGLALSPRAAVGHVNFTKFPKREGAYKTTAMVELTVSGEVAVRLPVSVSLELGAEAARSVLERGAQLHLVIERGAARVSAVGTALSDGDVGDVVAFRVQNTQKILRARIESRTSAKVVGN